MPAIVNLSVYRGDTWAQVFRFREGTHPVDFTGLTLASAARDPRGVTTALVVGGDASGLVTLRLPESGLQPNTYAYDIEVTDTDDLVQTWVRGTLYVVRDVTNEQP
jgi:hypothetical protein